MHRPWYQTSFRRNLIDMHIEGWDPRFLSKLDPDKYVEALKKALIQTAMIYANSHVGYCYWPTTRGQIHPGLKGKDFLGSLISRLHGANMGVVVYYSLLFDNWAYEHHPSWRMINPYGCDSKENSPDHVITGTRFGVCCPNNLEYRVHTALQILELVHNYSFEGMFFDMTFWLTVCQCPACLARYEKETGEAMPQKVDWNDPKWKKFQRMREEWITEYTDWVTSVVRSGNPSLSVEYNYATASTHWIFGVTEDIAKSGDYTGGDLYGGIPEQSFICKLYSSMTPNPPFEYMTSRCDPNLRFHTTTKSQSSLEQHVFTALAHHGAFLIIDAIDPDGTIHEELYRRMGHVFGQSMDYEPYLGGSIDADAGVYFSLRSKMDFNANGQPLRGQAGYPFGHYGQPHLNAALGAHETLKMAHIPVSVVSKTNLSHLSAFKILILPDLHFADDEEIEAFRKFVRAGGSLYISGHSAGTLPEDLGGTAGVIEKTRERFTYIGLTESGRELLAPLGQQEEISVDGRQILFQLPEADAGQQVLASVVLPFSDPDDRIHFASIHSNPPGEQTAYPSVTLIKYGMGKIIRIAAPIEGAKTCESREAFLAMVHLLAGSGWKVQTNAPPAVEVVVFNQKEQKRYAVSIVNEQSLLPPVPVTDIQVSIRMDGAIPRYAEILPHEARIPIRIEGDYAMFQVERLEMFQMILLHYE